MNTKRQDKAKIATSLASATCALLGTTSVTPVNAQEEPDWEFDTALRYVGDIEVSGTDIDDYIELDLRLGWKPGPGVELSIVGQNLLDSRHGEFLPDFIATQPTEVERSIFLRGIWKF